MNLKILNPSGGLKYHVRALLNRKRWKPFVVFVEAWLLDWRKQPKMTGVSTLVLIGPNAGYTMSPLFVSQFQNVIVVEPDPIAFALFEARFNCRSRWVRQDFFDLSSKIPNPQKLKDLFAAYPNAAFLFCNMLGQIPVILRERKNVDVEKYMKGLAVVLREVSAKSDINNSSPLIASYHDRYSRNLRTPDEVVDHLTGELFSFAVDKKEFPWRISSREEHQIEFVRK